MSYVKLKFFMEFLYLLIALLVALSVHEASHAWAAYLLGDPTAKMEGRVSLNPLRHLDPLGTLMIFIAHFGWGKPVPYDERNLKHPKRDAALIAIAGPISNLLTAFVIGIFLKYIPPHSVPVFLMGALAAIYQLSIVLFLFNLLPIAPLDGSKVVGLFVPRYYWHFYQEFLSKGPFFLILLIVTDRLLIAVTQFSPLGWFIGYGYDLISTLIFLAT